MKVEKLGIIALMFAAAAVFAQLPKTAAPEDAAVYFIAPAVGDIIEGEVVVLFGLEGMGVAPAGMARDNTGHHHLIIDAPLPPLDQPVPADDNYRHFGGGQTQVTIMLEPGEHTLQLLLADQNHIPHEPAIYSEVITIEAR